MAALRSLDDELETAAWRREFDRRIRNNHVCSLCGNTRHECVCPDERDDYAPSTGDTDQEAAA